MDITSDQVRAARALLRLQQTDLASRAGVSIVTIRRLEALDGRATVAPETMNRICAVLTKAGVEFIPGGLRRREAVEDQSTLFEELRAISRRSAQRLTGRDVLTDAELYDENGLPA